MRPRRSHKPPTPPKSALDALLDAAQADLVARGVSRTLAGPWIDAADLRMKTARAGGWSLPGTPQEFLAPVFLHRGWTWAWEEGGLVLGLPGWQPPKTVLTAVQGRLFG
jgi:hypothetical protein